MFASLATALLLLVGPSYQSPAPISEPAQTVADESPASGVTEELLAAARQTLDNDLADYPSARFRNVTAERTGNSIAFCGEVNSRNRMGGMTGWQRFWMIPNYPLPMIINPATPCDPPIDQTDYSRALTASSAAG